MLFLVLAVQEEPKEARQEVEFFKLFDQAHIESVSDIVDDPDQESFKGGVSLNETALHDEGTHLHYAELQDLLPPRRVSIHTNVAQNCEYLFDDV